MRHIFLERFSLFIIKKPQIAIVCKSSLHSTYSSGGSDSGRK